MTYIDRGDLIELLGSGVDDTGARRAIDDAAAAQGWTAPHRLDPVDALALLAQCASRPDAIGITAGLAHERLALRLARHKGLAPAPEPARATASGGRRGGV